MFGDFDGELRDEVAERDVALGIVPMGTGNLVATNLDLPKKLEAAVDVMLNGSRRRIDLGRVRAGLALVAEVRVAAVVAALNRPAVGGGGDPPPVERSHLSPFDRPAPREEHGHSPPF